MGCVTRVDTYSRLGIDDRLDIGTFLLCRRCQDNHQRAEIYWSVMSSDRVKGGWIYSVRVNSVSSYTGEDNMRYMGGLALALALFAAVSPLWAADEAPSGFYALGNLTAMTRDAGQLRPLSDVQLARFEGSSRMPRWGSYGRMQELRELFLMYLVYRLLGDILREGGATTPFRQNNFLIQLNIAIGNHILQTNDAIQHNSTVAMRNQR